MSKLSFELTRTDVRVKGNYFLLIQLDETEFPSKLTKTQKFRTEIDYSTQFPSFHQNYYSFNKVNLGNKLILRIPLPSVKIKECLFELNEVMISVEQKLEDIFIKFSDIQKDELERFNKYKEDNKEMKELNNNIKQLVTELKEQNEELKKTK